MPGVRTVFKFSQDKPGYAHLNRAKLEVKLLDRVVERQTLAQGRGSLVFGVIVQERQLLDQLCAVVRVSGVGCCRPQLRNEAKEH